MEIFFTILKHELLLSKKNYSIILANFLFFIISLIIFFMMAQGFDFKGVGLEYISAVIWILLISCLIFSSLEFLKKDFEDGTIEQMLIICSNFEVFTFARMLANWLIYALPILLAMPLVALFAPFNDDLMINFLILALLASLAINFICTFCGSLSLLENSGSMISIIALPLIIPILLIANGGIDPENFYFSCKILFGLSILLGAMTSVASAKVIKIISE